jgi:hypothetical protein
MEKDLIYARVKDKSTVVFLAGWRLLLRRGSLGLR